MYFSNHVISEIRVNVDPVAREGTNAPASRDDDLGEGKPTPIYLRGKLLPRDRTPLIPHPQRSTGTMYDLVCLVEMLFQLRCRQHSIGIVVVTLWTLYLTTTLS
jgi:hypothetical protein